MQPRPPATKDDNSGLRGSGNSIFRLNNLLSPGALTAANMFFGFLSIVNAIEGNLTAAGWFIVIAAIMDGFDGKLARLMKKGSQFGIQYDSIADMVSFGVAPAALIYVAFFKNLGTIGIFLAFCQILFGGMRLARFNLTAKTDAKEEFRGLPIPMAALSIASFVHFSLQLNEDPKFIAFSIPLVVMLSMLMVSGVRYDTFPKFTFNESGKNKIKLLFLLTSVALVAIFPGSAIFPLCMFIIVHGMIRSLFRTLKKASLEEEAKEAVSR